MSTQVKIPRGDETIDIQLTVREALALSEYVNFIDNPKLKNDARKKLKRILEQKLLH